MSDFRIGVIGLGGMAQAHMRMLAEQGDSFELVAVSDVNTETLHRVGEEMGVPVGKRYADYSSLVTDPDVDVVVSVTPNHTHAAIVEACLRAGKPFMAEKPFTRLFEEAPPLLALYQRRLQ